MSAGATYFLSDLHVRDAREPRTQRLLEFLDERRGEAEAIYLVGDVFDFSLGYRHLLFEAHFAMLRRLAEVVESGTRVVLMPGNHDPAPTPLLEDLGVEVHEGPLELELGGERVWVEHGDLVDPRGLRRRLICRVARNPLVHRVARAVHPEVAWRMAEFYAQRHSEPYEEMVHPDLPGRWLAERAEAGFGTVVLGHYHRAAWFPTPRAQLFVLGDWIRQRTFLRWDETFELLRDQGPGRPPLALPPGDHGPGLTST